MALLKIQTNSRQSAPPKPPKKTKTNLSLKVKRCQTVSLELLQVIRSNFALDDQLAEGLPLGHFFTSLFLIKIDGNFNHYAAVKDMIDKTRQARPSSAGQSVISSLDLYDKFAILFHSLFGEKRSKKVDYFKALRFLGTVHSKFSGIEQLSKIFLVFVLEQSLRLIPFKQLVSNLAPVAQMETSILGLSILNTLASENCSLILDEFILEKDSQRVLVLRSISNTRLLADFDQLRRIFYNTRSVSTSVLIGLYLGFLFSFLVKRLTGIYKRESEARVESGEDARSDEKYNLSLALVLTMETALEVFSFAADQAPNFWASFGWFQCFSSSYYHFLLFMHRFFIFCALVDFENLSMESFIKKIYFECWNASNTVSVFLEVFQNGKPLKTWIFRHVGEVCLARKFADFKSFSPRKGTSGPRESIMANFGKKSKENPFFPDSEKMSHFVGTKETFQNRLNSPNLVNKNDPQKTSPIVSGRRTKNAFAEPRTNFRKSQIINQKSPFTNLEKRETFSEKESKLALDHISSDSQKINFIASNLPSNGAFHSHFNQPKTSENQSSPNGRISSFQPIPQFPTKVDPSRLTRRSNFYRNQT